ncbi:MAG: putative dehydrogenase [Candidatus Latescibacterota bacterium]|jgi:predicted dehydrogenase
MASKKARNDMDVGIPQKVVARDRIAGHFIDCILDGTTSDAPLRHGLQVQQMMEALLKSAETGREVRIK